ncbi:MAG: permease [Treponema sp.]|nr:permease [Treponema sp.]
MLEVLRREAIYLWYYFDIQLHQIIFYWAAGIVIGSCVSVFAKNWIHAAAERAGRRVPGIVGLAFASALGIASPLCMYGTIPICAAFSRKGIKDDFLAAFMMSSVLLNPQLIVYSAALGPALLAVRIASSFVCGIAAGLLVRAFFCKSEDASRRAFFDFSAFDEMQNRDTDSNIARRLLKNILRNIKATGPWFLLGVALSAIFQRYVPAQAAANLFGKERAGFGILMAATVGVPLYVCGGGTIPLILEWLDKGMSAGSAAAFMITGPATKITNLGALKIALGAKHFALYFAFVILFSLATGTFVNIIF